MKIQDALPITHPLRKAFSKKEKIANNYQKELSKMIQRKAKHPARNKMKLDVEYTRINWNN